MMRICQNSEELARLAAEEVVARAQEAIAVRGEFRVALSGGSTPKALFQVLVQSHAEALDWSKVHLFWSDERYVPLEDPESNQGVAMGTLGELRFASVNGIFAEGGAEEAAKAYAALLEKPLDLVLLGLGTDGHTASLFPGSPSVHEVDRPVVASIAPVGVRQRITMTPPYINRCPVMFLVAGADKAAPLKAVLRGEEDWDETPAQAVARHASEVVWFVDEAASADL